ncbi:MAG: peptidoglycan DD-metalloendopeptidase family protein [Bacillota bacterium]
MRAWDIKPRLSMAARLRRAYRYSELFKLRCWLKGKTLHWALYLTVASLLLGAVLGFHNYLRGFYYVVCVGDQEVGYVRDAAEIEGFIVSLTERCSLNYGMPVEPREEISMQWEHRPGEEEDTLSVKEALRQSITMVTDAVMVTVDQVPVVPVATELDVQAVIDLMCQAYVSQADNIVLLEATLVEEVGSTSCTVRPEEVYSAEEVASLLMEDESPRELVALSRGGAEDDTEASGVAVIPLVHVKTVEEVTAEERIPFNTDYTYTSSMWTMQSRVITPGKDGSKEVVYHVTRENGVEIGRNIQSEKVLEHPVTQVVERGTASAPSMGTGQFIWPVAGGRLTAGFSSWHPAIDIAAPADSSVLAADSGVVVISEYIRYPQGNYIIIYHGKYWTVYLHNSANLVSAGTTVSKGQVIARVGSTGRSTGPHLHFEIRSSNGGGEWNHWYQHTPVNPLNFFQP